MNKAVFLDRDGTINVEKEYLYRVEQFEFIPGAVEAIRLFNRAGWLVIVVSNQSGVARGYYCEEDVELLHCHVAHELEKFGARVDGWFFCPHHPQGKGSYALPCRCRKPAPGMLLEAAGRFAVDLSHSCMIGDKLIDVVTGRNAGCAVSVLVRTGYGTADEDKIPEGTPVYDNLLLAARALVLAAS